MRLAGTQSWQARFDVPEKLQFGSFVAQQEGFSFDPTASPRSESEAQWLTWWNQLILSLAPPVGQEHTPMEWQPLLIYDSPNFNSLTGMPSLQERCRQHWPIFQALWSHEKMPLVAKMMEQLHAIAINDIIKSSAQSLGRREPRAFLLNVNFLRWPEEFRQQVSDGYIVLGESFLERNQLETFRSIIATFVLGLA